MQRDSERDAAAALARLMERHAAAWRTAHGSLPVLRHDPQWPSPCEVGRPDGNSMVGWEAVARAVPADFSGLERALECALHPDIKVYYGRYWCGHIEARADEGELTLIQVWNTTDFDRLCENILGHWLAQRRARVAFSVFFACTDEGDLTLGVDNASGRIVLEHPGRAAVREVAGSLAEFLDRVTPLPRAPAESGD